VGDFLKIIQNTWSRRSVLQLASAAIPFGVLGHAPRWPVTQLSENEDSAKLESVSDLFPTQPAELAREMVTVAHFDLRRVKELVEARPSLARASWDWGFGDWEDALGAASHMGNRPIAEYLISKGARPSLFSATMLGQLDVVKAFVAAQPGVQRIRGPHSISLLAHAKAGGEVARPTLDFLQSLGDAGAEPSAPLSDTDADAVRGTYIFGIAMSQRIDVTVDRGQATWTRAAMMGRPLFHLGNKIFYPWGAEAVRIRFAEEGESVAMIINDPGVVLVARRKRERK
jgi:hypothetical protein